MVDINDANFDLTGCADQVGVAGTGRNLEFENLVAIRYAIVEGLNDDLGARGFGGDDHFAAKSLVVYTGPVGPFGLVRYGQSLG